jgi:hypothetical protein
MRRCGRSRRLRGLSGTAAPTPNDSALPAMRPVPCRAEAKQLCCRASLELSERGLAVTVRAAKRRASRAPATPRAQP